MNMQDLERETEMANEELGQLLDGMLLAPIAGKLEKVRGELRESLIEWLEVEIKKPLISLNSTVRKIDPLLEEKFEDFSETLEERLEGVTARLDTIDGIDRHLRDSFSRIHSDHESFNSISKSIDDRLNDFFPSFRESALSEISSIRLAQEERVQRLATKLDDVSRSLSTGQESIGNDNTALKSLIVEMLQQEKSNAAQLQDLQHQLQQRTQEEMQHLVQKIDQQQTLLAAQQLEMKQLQGRLLWVFWPLLIIGLLVLGCIGYGVLQMLPSGAS